MLKKQLTRQQLIHQVSERDIFCKYFGQWEFGKSYSSAFRKDDHNSTGFYLTDHGNLIYNDLRTNDKYDCIGFVMKKYSLPYYKAINKIAADFGLNSNGATVSMPTIIKPANQLIKPLKKVFIIKACKFKKQHLEYWTQYGITLNELKANNIFAVESYVINKFDEHDMCVNTFHSPKTNDIQFAYTFSRNDEKFIKIYNPYNATFKWVGNVPLDLPFGIDTLPYKSDTLIITKSVKDCIVLRKFYTDVIGLQNESSSSITDELLQELKQKYKHIYVWFDYDRAGLKAYRYYREKYGFKCLWTVCNTNSIWKNLQIVKQKHIKDPSDFVARYTIDVFEKYLKYYNDKLQKC